MSKRKKVESPVAPPITMQWKLVEGSTELPRPLPLEFTPRQLHYLLQIVAFDAGRPAYKDDATALKLITETHTKLMLVQRMYFDDLEAIAAHARYYRVTPKVSP